MSAVKSLAIGVSMMMLAAPSSRGGTIREAESSHPRSTGRDVTTPTTLVYAQNRGHAVAAENLAPPTNNSYWSSYQAGYLGSPGHSGGLSLGVTGGGWNSYTTPLTPPPAPVQSYQAPAPAQSYQAPAPAQSYQAPAPTPSPATPDAFINFGNAPYPEANSLTTGNPQPFFNSPVFTHLFGSNGPTSTDLTNFEAEVVQTIKNTYNKAGLAINLTTDPNAQAPHTMSVVSGASYTGVPGAIGITDVGNSGFSFIDKFGGVQNADQLAIAIGHNLSHELMHAFGIANHPEQTGNFVDAATSTLSALTDPNTGFSPAAANLLSTLNFQAVGQSVTAGAQRIDGDQILISAAPVPEPSTVALWVVAGGLVLAARRRKIA